LRAFLLFNLEGIASIAYVHLYDGATLVSKYYKGFGNFADGYVGVGGDHTSIDAYSTFEPLELHSVQWGLSLSFKVSCPEYWKGRFLDFSERPILTVISAGADYLSGAAEKPFVLEPRTTTGPAVTADAHLP
jgi:hypothetical protein